MKEHGRRERRQHALHQQQQLAVSVYNALGDVLRRLVVLERPRVKVRVEPQRERNEDEHVEAAHLQRPLALVRVENARRHERKQQLSNELLRNNKTRIKIGGGGGESRT